MKYRAASYILIPVIGLFLVFSVHAVTEPEYEWTCPICKHKFKHPFHFSGTDYRLDLKPMKEGPARLPECPQCGFVMYNLFEKYPDDKELERSREIVTAPEYTELRRRPAWRRVAFIFEKLQKDESEIGLAFLMASWQEEANKEFYRDDLEKSLAHFTAYLNDVKQNRDAKLSELMLVGEIMRLLGKFEDAAKHFEAVIRSKDITDDSYFQFELYLCRKKDANHYTLTRDVENFCANNNVCSVPVKKKD